MLRFATKVESKRIPTGAPDEEKTLELLSSQEAALKNTDSLSQSQPQIEVEPDVTPFILTRSHATFFSVSSSSSEPTAKRQKAFHETSDTNSNSADEKTEAKQPGSISIPPLMNLVSMSQPLLDCIERHLAQIELDTETEKTMVAKFLYKLASAYQNKNVTEAAFAAREFKRRKQPAVPKPEDAKKAAAKKALKLTKARTADKLLLDNKIRDCIIAAAALGDRKAELALQKYKLRQAQKPTRRLKSPLPTVDPLFTGNPASYLPALRKFMIMNASDLDFHFPPEKVQAIVQSLISFVDAHFYEYRNSLLPSSSLSLRR